MSDDEINDMSAGTVLGYSILNTMLEEALRERDEAIRGVEILKRASLEVLKVIPLAHCSEMHHRKSDMHSASDPCPVVKRYNARIDNLRALLKEEAK